MELKKVIEKLNIGNEYTEFVDDFIREVKNIIGDNLHSVYMCGSIPKGIAVPYKSDADFTVVLNNDCEINPNLDNLKLLMMEKYPFITKIDTPTIREKDVRDNNYSWGFWLKIICICVDGSDIGTSIQPIEANRKLIVGINDDTIDTIKKQYDDYVSRDESSNDVFRRSLIKRIIRAFYTFTLELSGIWTDDIVEMKYWINEEGYADSDLVELLYKLFESDGSDCYDIKLMVNKSIAYIEQRLSMLKVD